MSDDVKLEILLQAKNQSAAAFNELKQQLSGMQQEMAKTSKVVKRDFDGMASTVNGFKSIFATAFAGFGVAEFARTVLKASSDLEEATSKFNVVFEGQGRQAAAAVDLLTESYAMSTREARQYLSGMQDLLVPLGIMPEKAQQLSTEVVKLAADLGSFNNLPTAQVIADIQSALVGQYETMKKYGVVINDTIAKERAVALGLAKTKDEVTYAHKAYAAFTLMIDNSKAAIGDMARTWDSAANNWKRWNANIDELSATIGDVFMPAANEALKVLNELVGAAKKVFDLAKATNQLSLPSYPRPAPRGAPTNDAVYSEYQRAYLQTHSLREMMTSGYIPQAGVGGASQAGVVNKVQVSTRDFKANADAVTAATKALKEHRAEKSIWEGWGTRPYTESEAFLADQRAAQEFQARWADFRQRPYQESEAFLADQKTWEQWKKSAEDSFNSMVQLSERTADAIEQNFSDLFFDAWKGELKTAEDYFQAFSDSIGRMVADLAGQMLKTGLFGAGQNGQAMGGLLGSLFGYFGGSSSPEQLGQYSARGNVFGPGGVERFAAGGVVTRPTVFAFARGAGIMGEAGPEAILPLKRGAGGRLGVEASGGGVQVTVNNYSGERASVKETRGPGGNRQIMVTIGADIASGGPVARQIESTYGLRRAGRLG